MSSQLRTVSCRRRAAPTSGFSRDSSGGGSRGVRSSLYGLLPAAVGVVNRHYEAASIYFRFRSVCIGYSSREACLLLYGLLSKAALLARRVVKQVCCRRAAVICRGCVSCVSKSAPQAGAAARISEFGLKTSLLVGVAALRVNIAVYRPPV